MAAELLLRATGTEEKGQSSEQLRGRLYSSLLESGVIDNLKTQLRTQILRQLRSVDASILDPSTTADSPKLPQRILNSLFIDYLNSQGYVYTLSVFTPECGMASEVPFTREELRHLLHLRDPTSVLSKNQPEEESGKSLAWQLMESLEHLRGPSNTIENGSQTWDAQGGDLLESHLRSIEESYLHRMDTEKLLPYHSLEERMDHYRREVDQRARAEIAAAVDRVRQFEVGAARMEEATRYRRQLEDAREDLERAHSEQVRRREESQRERWQRLTRDTEAAAHEHRQRMLAENETLRERESKLKQLEDIQLKTLKVHEERLLEKAAAVKEREDDVARLRGLLLSQAEEHGQMRRREVEREYETLLNAAKKDRELLEIERARFADERATFADELSAGRESRGTVRQLERHLLVAREQAEISAEAVKELEARVARNAAEKRALLARLSQTGGREAELDWSYEGLASDVIGSCNHGPVIEKLQALRSAERKGKRRAETELENLRESFQKQVREWREQQAEWRLVERHLQARVARLHAEVAAANDGKEQAVQRTEEMALRLKAVEREAADVTHHYREAKAALQADQLAHRAAPRPEPFLPAASQHELRNPHLDMFLSDAAQSARHSSPATDQYINREYTPVSPPGNRLPGSRLPAPVLGPQTAASSGALQRLNELEREEQHMQHALEDFRARARTGLAAATRAAEQAARMPDRLRPQVRSSEESESNGESSSARGAGFGSSGESSAEKRQTETRGDPTRRRENEKLRRRPESTESRGDSSKGRESEQSRQSAKERNGGAVLGEHEAGGSATLEVPSGNNSLEDRAKSEAEATLKLEREPGTSENVEAARPNQAGRSNLSAKGEGRPVSDENGGANESDSAHLDRVESLAAVPEVLTELEESARGKVPANSSSGQDARLAGASTDGDEEVLSPKRIERQRGGGERAESDPSREIELPPVKTEDTNAKARDGEKEDVKSPDTVTVLVRRKEGAPLGGSSEADVAPADVASDEADGQVAQPGGADARALDTLPSEAPQTDKAEPNENGNGNRNGNPLVAQTLERLQPEQVRFRGEVQPALPRGGVRKGAGSKQRRAEEPVNILEEVARLAEKEAPNAESRTTTPRETTGFLGDKVGTQELGRVAGNQARARVGLELREAFGLEGDNSDVHSETGSVSPVAVTLRGVPAWASVPETAQPGRRESEPAGGSASDNGTAEPVIKAGQDMETRFREKEPLGRNTAGEVLGNGREAHTSREQLEVLANVGTEGGVLDLATKPAVDCYANQPAEIAVEKGALDGPTESFDAPIVTEGTAVAPKSVSRWEQIQADVQGKGNDVGEAVGETTGLKGRSEQERATVPRDGGREGDPKQGFASPAVASEIEEELEIDYEDAAYSEAGLSGLSVPAEDFGAQGDGSDGW